MHIDDIIAEAKAIGAKIKSRPRTEARDPADAARVVRLLEATQLPPSEFVRRVGYWSTSTIYNWRLGKKADGCRWPALEQALISAPKILTASESLPRPGEVTSITVWLDSTGQGHQTEADAKRASLAHATRHAAEQVANFETVTNDLAVALVEAGDLVIALADAIKAEREFAAMRSR